MGGCQCHRKTCRHTCTIHIYPHLLKAPLCFRFFPREITPLRYPSILWASCQGSASSSWAWEHGSQDHTWHGFGPGVLRIRSLQKCEALQELCKHYSKHLVREPTPDEARFAPYILHYISRTLKVMLIQANLILCVVLTIDICQSHPLHISISSI